MTENQQSSSGRAECVDYSANTLTKTQSPSEEVLGIVGSGVVRRRSVRRRISRDDGKPKYYGQKKEEYEKIIDRVLSQKTVVNAIDTLKERWRMVMFMYEDCMEMVRRMEEKQEKKKIKQKQKELCVLAFGVLSVIIPMVLIVWRWG